MIPQHSTAAQRASLERQKPPEVSSPSPSQHPAALLVAVVPRSLQILRFKHSMAIQSCHACHRRRDCCYLLLASVHTSGTCCPCALQA